MNLDAARLFVRDIAAARHFYAGQLGLPLQVDGRAQGFCVFQPGAMRLVVEQVPADAPADEQVLVGRFSGLSFRVDDVQAAYRALQARGVPFDGTPEPQPWGGVLATLRDPDGNALQLCQYP